MHIKSFVEKLNFTPFYDGPDASGDLGNLDSLDDVSILESDDDNPEGDEDAESTDDSGDDKSAKGKNKGAKDSEEDSGEETEDTEEDAEETEEETEDEEEVEEEEEEEEPEIVKDSKISVKSLKEQYPEIFKKNPGLKDVIFREREYSKLGPVDDVREAVEKAQSFDNFESRMMEGHIGELIDAIAESDQNAAVKIAKNFLPAIFERSKPLYAEIATPVVKGVLRNVFTRANNHGDRQLILACQYLSRELFEDKDVLKATRVEEDREDPREKEIQEERNKVYKERFDAARTDVIDNVQTRLRSSISKQLDGNLSEFIREALTDKIINELDVTLVKDKAHMANLSSLWKKASKQGFNSDAKSRIISASLARARAILPAVISKVKAKEKGSGNGKPASKKAGEKQVPNQGKSKMSANGQPRKLDRTVSDFDFLSQP